VEIAATLTHRFAWAGLRALGIAFIFLVVVAAGCWVCNRLGWFNVRGRGPTWLKAILTVLLVSAGGILGFWAGISVAVPEAALKAADEIGRPLVEGGLASAAAVAGLPDVRQALDGAAIDRLLAGLEDAERRIESSGIAAYFTRRAFAIYFPAVLAEARTRLQEINARSPGEKISPSELLSLIWADVRTRLERQQASAARTILVVAAGLLTACFLTAIAVAGVARVAIRRVFPAPPTGNHDLTNPTTKGG
jgi:hypothetical protein